jgi:hypothetical protein
MYVSFIREGFANNSSSSHSIILPKDFDSVPDRSGEVSSCEYGWSFFTLKSRIEKEAYLLTALKESIHDSLRNVEVCEGMGISNQVFDYHVAAIKGFKHLSEDLVESAKEGYIDHQSQLYFPIRVTRQGVSVDMEFFNAFAKEILDKSYVILGGNDNDETPFGSILDNSDAHWVIRYLSRDIKRYSKYDESFDEFVIIDAATGGEVRVGFGPRKNAQRASFPSLVDLSVGDYCDSGCAFCYTGSSTKGSWAQKGKITSMTQTLYHGGCIQFVLGGGEPTKHPDIAEILKGMMEVAPRALISMTTRNYEWHKSLEYAACVGNIKSVAISCNTVKDVEAATDMAHSLAYAGVSVTIQNIVGLQDTSELALFLDAVVELRGKSVKGTPGEISVTLLGWKDSHRGATGPAHKNVAWIDLALLYNKEHHMSVAVDACLSELYGSELELAGVDPKRMSSKEGMYSCYVDIKNHYLRKSSYEGAHYDLSSVGDYYTSNNVKTFAKLFKEMK